MVLRKPRQPLPKVREAFSSLIGLTVVDVIAETSAGYGEMRPNVALVLGSPRAPAELRLYLWAVQDIEGNGPGFYEITTGPHRD